MGKPAELDFVGAWRKALACPGGGFAISPRLASSPSSLLVRPQRRGRLWLLLAAVLLLLAAWLVAPRGSHAEVINRIAAIINNEIITESELSRAVAAKGKGGEAAAARREMLEKMIDEMLLGQIMASSKVEVTDDDLARAIADILRQNRMSLEELRAEIQAKGMTYEEYKKQISQRIRRIKYLNQVVAPKVRITDQDLRDHYQRNQEQFRGGARAHIAEIILPTQNLASEAETQALADTALAIAGRARKGASFDALVKQYAKEGVQGGDLGMVDMKELSPEIAQIVRALRPGEVSNPVFTGQALVIVKLVALPEIAPGDFDRMRDQIYAALYDQKIEETLSSYLQKERQRAFIEVR